MGGEAGTGGEAGVAGETGTGGASVNVETDIEPDGGETTGCACSVTSNDPVSHLLLTALLLIGLSRRRR